MFGDGAWKQILTSLYGKAAWDTARQLNTRNPSQLMLSAIQNVCQLLWTSLDLFIWHLMAIDPTVAQKEIQITDVLHQMCRLRGGDSECQTVKPLGLKKAGVHASNWIGIKLDCRSLPI